MNYPAKGALIRFARTSFYTLGSLAIPYVIDALSKATVNEGVDIHYRIAITIVLIPVLTALDKYLREQYS